MKGQRMAGGEAFPEVDSYLGRSGDEQLAQVAATPCNDQCIEGVMDRREGEFVVAGDGGEDMEILRADVEALAMGTIRAEGLFRRLARGEIGAAVAPWRRSALSQHGSSAGCGTEAARGSAGEGLSVEARAQVEADGQTNGGTVQRAGGTAHHRRLLSG
jgi:hypothetical protein